MLTDTAVATEEEVTKSTAKALTKLDRCDGCGSQAWISAEKLGVTQLLFCHHHGKEYSKALTIQGFTIKDYTHLLFEEEARIT